MDWRNETVMCFLELYKMHPCIWDPKHAWHKNKTRLNDAWIDIKNNLGEPCTVKELKKKKESLMAAYRGYRTKITKSETSGSDVYKPTWFAYALMDSFMGAVYKNPSIVPVHFMKTEVNQNTEDIADSNNDQDDTGDAYTDGETDPLNPEQNFFAHASLQRGTTNQRYSQHKSTATSFKRKQHNPSELQKTKKQMNQVFNILKSASRQHLNEDEDESCIFGKLIAKKMRKLPEDRRDLMMIKINQLFYDEHHRQNPSSSIPSPLSRIQQDDSIP